MAKYKNKKTMINGIEFDSKKEAYRYLDLLTLERAGKIKDLQMQVKYELIPKQYGEELTKAGSPKVIERECNYVADFQYYENGRLVVEDVKGYRRDGAYVVFKIKRKLMLYIHGIRVREV